MKKLILFCLILLSSCASVKVNGQTRLRLETIGDIQKRCKSLKGQTMIIDARYLGWNCPEDCKNPLITRSDSCIKDSTGCIYILGTGNLNPITDRGKLFRFKVQPDIRKGICYLKVIAVHEIK
ncbi:MAG: hypothetical protein GWP10_22515 [Nitrospiraceae bacterium]|nr:hypothetical protein [Nitrospiraceae bacterium]